MPRTRGTTNHQPWTTAPPVGAAGDTYYNSTEKVVYLSDGTAWIAQSSGAPVTVTTLRERAWATATQNTVAGQFQKVTLAAQQAAFGAAGAHFDLANSRFVAPMKGSYRFNANVTCATASSGLNRWIATLYKNGAEYSRGTDFMATTTNTSCTSIATDVIDLQQGDYVELWLYCSHVVGTFAGIGLTYLEVELLSGLSGAVPDTSTAVHFHGGLTIQQMLTSGQGGWQRVNINSVHWDTGPAGACWNAANYRWVCPADGVYEAFGNVSFYTGATVVRALAAIWKNGATGKPGSPFGVDGSLNDWHGGPVYDQIALVAGDYLELYCYVSQPAGGWLNYGSGGETFFGVRRISGPSIPATADGRGAYGIVALQAPLSDSLTAVIGANTTANIFGPLSCPFVAGRRYRLVAKLRATGPVSTATSLYLRFTGTPAFPTSNDVWQWATGANTSLMAEMIFDGDGVSRSVMVSGTAGPQGNINIFQGQTVSGFYIEDVGPTSIPVAIPRPDAAKGLVAFYNSYPSINLTATGTYYNCGTLTNIPIQAGRYYRFRYTARAVASASPTGIVRFVTAGTGGPATAIGNTSLSIDGYCYCGVVGGYGYIDYSEIFWAAAGFNGLVSITMQAQASTANGVIFPTQMAVEDVGPDTGQLHA